ncbi:hypothetical protein D3C84_574070 [compost metagenome]
MTTAMINRPDSAIFAWLAATTAVTMITMLTTDTSGNTSTAWRTLSPSTRWATTPSTIGSSTTCRIDQNNSMNDTGNQAEASSQIRAGVSSGARRVVTAAMATDSARSPRASQVITFDEVPLGQQPTRITPTAISGGKWNAWQSNHATPGMITKWATTPKATRHGWRATSAKSSSLRVRPMPNITSPSKGTMAPLRPRNHAGCRNATTAKISTQ